MAAEDAFHVVPTQQPQGGVAPFEVGSKLELEPPPVIYGPGATAELFQLFEDGLTRHGKQYMAEGPSNPSLSPQWATEAFFEAVRRAGFEELPSRMQSVFGFGSLLEAEGFLGAYRANQPCAIYRIRGEVAHKANMSLLQFGGLPGAFAFQLANNYWQGKQGPRPACWELLLRPPIEVVELVQPVVQ